MLIYLLRHGDAVQNPPIHDGDRSLTDLGRQQSETVARFLKTSGGRIDTVLCSPLRRAQESAGPAKSLLEVENFIVTEYLAPASDPRQLIDQVNSLGTESVLLVGHEPFLSGLVSLMVAGETGFAIDFRKSSLALVESPSPIRKGNGVLKWLITVEHMHLER